MGIKTAKETSKIPKCSGIYLSLCFCLTHSLIQHNKCFNFSQKSSVSIEHSNFRMVVMWCRYELKIGNYAVKKCSHEKFKNFFCLFKGSLKIPKITIRITQLQLIIESLPNVWYSINFSLVSIRWYFFYFTHMS